MPFDSKTASLAGKKGGSKTKDPANKRTEHFLLKATIEEKNMIDEKASAAKLSRNEFLIQAAKAFNVE